MNRFDQLQHDDKNYDCPATALGDTTPGKCICHPQVEVCENEPVLPYPGDCETVENMPVLL